MAKEIALKEVINIPIFRFIITTYKNIGLWPPAAETTSPCRRLSYFLAAALFHFFMTFLYALSMVTNILLKMNVGDLYITLTELGMICKCSHFFKHHKEFQGLAKEIFNNPIFNLRNPEEREIYERNLKTYTITVTGFLSSCTVVIIIGVFSSLFSDPITLSYPAYFPFDCTSSRNFAYFVVFFYQNSGMGLHCLMNSCWDSLMPFYMVNLSSQFQVLGERLKSGFTKPRDSERTREELVRNIEHYNALVSFNRDLQREIAFPVALQIGTTGLVLCITMMQLVTVSPMDNLAAYGFYVIYMVALLAQVYLQCYFSSLSAHESEKLLQALFSANWLEIDLKNRKLLMMFMIRLREACRIKTMKVFPVDRRAFMSILNMSYSLYAVLRKTNRFNK